MNVRVLIDQTYEYLIDNVSSVRVAISRASAQHDQAAKARQKAGFSSPRTLSQMARSAGALRIFATIDRQRASNDAEELQKVKRRRVRRGVLR